MSFPSFIYWYGYINLVFGIDEKGLDSEEEKLAAKEDENCYGEADQAVNISWDPLIDCRSKHIDRIEFPLLKIN